MRFPCVCGRDMLAEVRRTEVQLSCEPCQITMLMEKRAFENAIARILQERSLSLPEPGEDDELPLEHQEEVRS